MRREAGRAGAYPVLVLLLLLLCACSATEARGDSLDTLFSLIGQRLALAEDVARSKWNSGAAVEDLARENEIVEAIGRDAGKYGLDPTLAKTFFRAQIEASKIVQNARLAEWRISSQPKFSNAPDLQRDIRPQIDRLTPALLDALAHAVPALRTRESMVRLETYAAANAARAAAIAPLRTLAAGA